MNYRFNERGEAIRDKIIPWKKIAITSLMFTACLGGLCLNQSNTLQQLKSQDAEAKKKTANLDSQLNELKNKNSDLDSRIEQKNQQISQLKIKISQLKIKANIFDLILSQPKANVLANQPVSGFLLKKQKNDYVEIVESSLKTKNFVLGVRFVNPEPGNQTDFGIGFRSAGGNKQYRLVINPDSSWNLALWTDRQQYKDISEGKLSHWNSQPGGNNDIVLIAQNGEAHFYINGSYVDKLDISAKQELGTSFIGIDFTKELEEDGKEFQVQYENFLVIPLDK